MGNRRVYVRLKGGLGNQLFQYAAGRALALRTRTTLVLDASSGFTRDRLYRRTFSLARLPIRAATGGVLTSLPFWFEHVWMRGSRLTSGIRKRPWGVLLYEAQPHFFRELLDCPPKRDTWMDGYWQSEEYFADYDPDITLELMPPAPASSTFLGMASLMGACNSVAVGVRIFEDIPGVDKSGGGGLAPLQFYEAAARELERIAPRPSFFVFCTSGAAVRGRLKLPGEVHYVTPDEGFADPLNTLWLTTRCRHHILSNSSFFWWGAWLSERKAQGNVIIACDLFPNRHTIPKRWTRYPVSHVKADSQFTVSPKARSS